jgi:ABC-type proline/glycine betaine transport system permease subunit
MMENRKRTFFKNFRQHLRISNLSTFAVLASGVAICYNKIRLNLSICKSFKRDQRRKGAVKDVAAKSKTVATATGVACIEGCGEEIIFKL